MIMNTKKLSHRTAVILTLCVAFLWSLAGLNMKLIHWSSYAVAGGRSLLAALFLIPILLKSGRLKIDRYVIGGAICYAAFNYCFIFSTKSASSAIAVMMQYTAPLYVAILAWFLFKEKITKMDVIALIAVSIGMVLFMLDGEASGSQIGKIVAIFNGFSFAGISIFLRYQKDGNPVMSVFLGNALGGILGIPFMVQGGIPDASSMLFLLLAGFLFGLTYTVYAIASKSLTALETVLFPVFDPVLNPVWVFLVMGEAPGLFTIVGAVLILVAILARSLIQPEMIAES